MKNELWWHGPEWLYKPECSWPDPEFEVKNESDAMYESELKLKTRNESTLLQSEKESQFANTNTPFNIDSEQFSSATKMIRVTALAFRFVNKLRKKCLESGYLKSKELQNAEKVWIKCVQKQQFREVFRDLANKRSNNLQRQLGLFVDKDGVLRCRGRLQNSNLTPEAINPILLPKDCRLTYLLIERAHKQLLHSGTSHTLSQMRNKYWILKGRATVRSVLAKCSVCRKVEGGPYEMPLMPPLPKSRVTKSSPFTRTGLDYLGPLYIKTHDYNSKVWVCLFTCLVTRAVHLEIVQDMSADEFILALKRFISLRGQPCEIISDNAMQFKAASKMLNTMWKNVFQSEEVQSYSANTDIKWSFIVELAPWMGGFYERLVGLVKRALRKSLGKKLLTLVQLQTMLREVEAVINTRPLVYVGEDFGGNILTPAHFLLLNPKVVTHTIAYDEQDEDYTPYESTETKLLMIWKKGQKLVNSFWKTWRDDYLLNLRERTQLKLKSKRIQFHCLPNVGDVVLIKDDCPRGSWKLGKIIELCTSSDGNIRSAKVQTSSGRILGRPLNLLYPLEVSNDQPQELKMLQDSSVGEMLRDSKDRKSKEVARKKIHEMFESSKQ